MDGWMDGWLHVLLHHSVFVWLQNELVFRDIIRLSLDSAVSEGPEGAQQPSIGKVSITLHVMLCHVWAAITHLKLCI